MYVCIFIIYICIFILAYSKIKVKFSFEKSLNLFIYCLNMKEKQLNFIQTQSEENMQFSADKYIYGEKVRLKADASMRCL